MKRSRLRRSRYSNPRTSTRQWRLVGVATVAVAVVGAGLGVASAHQRPTAAGVPTVNCPQLNVTVAVPTQANDEVRSNLELLNKQIDEANARLVSSVGQGGPNFIQNAILGPLRDKRVATINRIQTAIGRNAPKPNFNPEGISTCGLNSDGGESVKNSTTFNVVGEEQNTNGGDEARAQEAPAAPPAQANADNNGLNVLANSCATSGQPAHDGFQKGDRCVSTQFGEVGLAFSNPSLLITDAPQQVGVNEGFTLRVSTRNLKRDRFLAAGQGGYYLESALLEEGITRGHFHTACRVLGRTDEAPAPEPVPAFFVATEDGQGSRTPDTVEIQVPGIATAGTVQCAAWAGDGSHRIPMMERANQTPAFDAVRIQVG